MSKRKKSKALFEVIGAGSSRSRKPPKPAEVPDGFGRTSPPVRKPLTSGASRTALGAEDREPVVSLTRGRLRVSLNQVSATVFVGGLLALLVLAFLVGYRLGPGKGATPLPPERSGPGTDGGGIGGPDGSRGDDGQRSRAPDGRKKGLYYLVVQNIVWSRAEAEEIKKYLAGSRVMDGPVMVTIERMPATTGWRIRDTRTFESPGSPQANAYKKGIEALGRVYRNRGGKYDFHACSFMREP